MQCGHKIQKNFCDRMNQDNKQLQRRIIMNTEKKILLKLTEILEKEHLISPAEKNRATGFIEKGGI